jgi:hypothetical protein
VDRRETVVVHLDGLPLHVPPHAGSSYEARGTLGVPRGLGVAREGTPEVVLDLTDGWTFSEGDRYVLVGFEAYLGRLRGDDDAEEDADRGPWHVDPDAWKG